VTLKEMLQSPEAKKMYRELAKKFHTDIPGGDEKKIRVINNLKDAKEVKDKEIVKLYKEWFDKKEKEVKFNNTEGFNYKEKVTILKKWSKEIQDNYPVVTDVYVIESRFEIRIIFSLRKKMELKNLILNKAEKFSSKQQLEKEFKKKLEKVF